MKVKQTIQRVSNCLVDHYVVGATRNASAVAEFELVFNEIGYITNLLIFLTTNHVCICQACVYMHLHLQVQMQMRHLHLHLHLIALWRMHLHLHLLHPHLQLHSLLIQIHFIEIKCETNANQMRRCYCSVMFIFLVGLVWNKPREDLYKNIGLQCRKLKVHTKTEANPCVNGVLV